MTSNPKKNQDLREKAAAYKTQEKLSFANCQSSFQNILRTGDPVSGHVETKICNVPIKVNRRRDQTSHIFTGEDPATIKPSSKALVKKPQKDNVMFNDFYVEKNPNANSLKYEMEKRHKASSRYSDDFKISERRKNLMQRKINDNFLHNPLRIYNKNEIDQFNQEQLKQSQKHAAFNKTFASDGTKRTLGGINNNKIKFGGPQEGNNKITNNGFDITNRAFELNKNEDNKVPYYARKHFRHASAGRGGAMCYG